MINACETGNFSPRLVRLSVYDFVQYDFFGAVADVVHPAQNPNLNKIQTITFNYRINTAKRTSIEKLSSSICGVG